jgi:hypothetical protein
MKRLIAALLTLALIAGGCAQEQFSDELPGNCLNPTTRPECQPRPDEGMTLSLRTECGLSQPRIWMDSDEAYRFDVPANDTSVPFGWGQRYQEVTVKREGGQVVVYGPFDSRYVLVRDREPENLGCD